MARTEKSSRRGRVSVWNWLGTLILCSIPGVNLITLILTIIFAKAQAKRSFAIAMLVLMALAVVIAIAVVLAFPEALSQMADQLRETSAGTQNLPAGQILNLN